MQIVVRTLPKRTEPVDGEALDSWLEVLSHRLSCTWGDLTDAIRLTNTGGTTPWLLRLTPEEAANLSLATGQPAAELHAMTLARYDGTGLRIRQDVRAADRTFPWTRTRFSRYCPHCLRDTGGRWQLYWRAGWTFACQQHRCLLVDECPQCGQRQRERCHPCEQTPEPGCCAQPALGATGRARQRCGADLTAVSTLDLPDGHSSLAAQRTILDVIKSGTMEFGIYRKCPQPSVGLLADVRAVAGRILGYATDDDLARILPPDLNNAHRRLRTRGNGIGAAPVPDDKPGLAAPAHAVIAAAGVTAAMDILGAPDCVTAGDRLRWLADSGRADGLSVSASNIGWGRNTTPVLTAAQINALAPHLKPSEQLRYRIGTPTPTRPTYTAADSAALVAKLPAALWPTWAVRLALPTVGYTYLSIALPCAVLLVNTRLSFDAATTAMDRRDVDGHSLSHTLQQLHGDRRWAHIRDALVRLADYLREHDGPIDYRRRRSLNYEPLLTAATWQRICADLDIRSGGEKRYRLARCHLYALISASPARYAPWYIDVNDFSAPLANFPALLTPALLSALQREAHRFLQNSGVDEPLTWNPPEHLLEDLPLPGPDPDSIDLTDLHRLVRKPLPLSEIAKQLGTSTDSVRYALSVHPAPELQRSQTFRPAPAFSGLAQKLTAAELTDLYVEQKLSLRQIAARYGVERKLVARLARQYGITLRRPQTPRRHDEIDRDWLHTEYVLNRRTLPELAAEKGMSTMNMSRWAKHHGIPLRGRGGPSHTATVNAAKAGR